MGRIAQSGTRSDRAGLTMALIYTRVSSDDQAREGVSLDAQLAACRRYAVEKGWVIGREYQDVLSGKRDDRREYQALLADIRRLRAEGRALAVVVMRLDRFGRRVLERVRSREDLKSLGVPTHSVREGGEVSDLMANMLAVMAQEEVERLGARVRDAREYITAHGWSVPGRKPWGYRWRDATGEERAMGAPKRVLEEDPETGPYVRELFDRAARGESVRRLVRWLAALPSGARGGKVLGYSAVRKALRAPVYVARHGSGERKHELELLAQPGQKWPALVDDETRATIHRRFASHARVPLQATGQYLLTGFIRCHKCGSRMTGSRLKLQRSRYRCLSVVPYCPGGVTARTVDRAVLGDLEALLEPAASSDPRLRSALRRAWRQLEPSDESARARQQAQHLEQAAARSRQRIARATEMYVDGNLTRANYDALCAKNSADIEAAEAELARLRSASATPTLPPLDGVLREVGGWASALRNADTADRREVLKVLVASVVPERVGYGKYAVRIDWTPTGEALRRASEAMSSAEVA